jgi:hypothetical protein
MVKGGKATGIDVEEDSGRYQLGSSGWVHVRMEPSCEAHGDGERSHGREEEDSSGD